MTPTLLEIQQRHRAFHAKIAAKAKPDPGITCASVSVRVPAPEIAPPDPAVIFAQWLERQAAINPIPARRKPRRAKSGPKPKHPFVACEIEPISIRLIQQVVAFEYGITMVDMFSSRRMGGIVFPRQVAMYLAKVLTVRSLPDIGRRFGGRDHTTILHAVRKISALVKADPELRERLERLALELGGSLT